jgi:hypothetical protein
LIAGLKRMGIRKVAGLSLERLQEGTDHCLLPQRSRIVRRQQQERNSALAEL